MCGTRDVFNKTFPLSFESSKPLHRTFPKTLILISLGTISFTKVCTTLESLFNIDDEHYSVLHDNHFVSATNGYKNQCRVRSSLHKFLEICFLVYVSSL